MRRVHLIKEIEATIKRGPKSKSRFTPANTHTGLIETGSPSRLSPQHCWRPSSSSGVAFPAFAWRFDPHHHLAGLVAGTASTKLPVRVLYWELGVYFYLYQLLKKKRKEKGKKKGKNAEQTLSIVNYL